MPFATINCYRAIWSGGLMTQLWYFYKRGSTWHCLKVYALRKRWFGRAGGNDDNLNSLEISFQISFFYYAGFQVIMRVSRRNIKSKPQEGIFCDRWVKIHYISLYEIVVTMQLRIGVRYPISCMLKHIGNSQEIPNERMMYLWKDIHTQ